MPEYTANYNLIKPGYDETADIADINENMDTIDGKLKENADGLSTHSSKAASTSASGHVQLQTTVDNSETTALTPKALNTHMADDTKHITSTERTIWNNKLDASAYTAADVLAKVKTVDGDGSGLDADLLDGAHAGNGPNNVLKLDSGGFVPLPNIPGTLTGKSADMVDGKHFSDIQNDAQAKVDTHANLTNNPHSVTKSQVGLGSVSNYGLATQAEAEAGTSSAKYMTPLRTKQAIDALQAVKSVAGKTGTVTLTKGDVGLSNVDNVKQATKVEFDEHVADGATIGKLGHVYHATLTTTLDTTWTGTEAPYSKTQTVTGIIANDNPIIDVVMSGNFEVDKERANEWSKIYRITTADNSITLYATDKPTVSLPIQLKVVR